RRSEEGRDHRRHRAPLDRPRGDAGPDRRSRPRAHGFVEVKLEVDGKAAFAYTANHDLDPKKRTVVFIHGAGLDHSWFGLQSRYFGYHGWNVLALDLPGHGRSEGPPLASVAAMADWTVRVLEAAKVARAALVGHSMGTLMELDCAARHA